MCSYMCMHAPCISDFNSELDLSYVANAYNHCQVFALPILKFNIY